MSNKKIVITLFFLTLVHFLSRSSFCQPVEVARIMDAAGWLGEWEGTYKVTGGERPGTAKDKITISGVENNIYVQIHLEGDMVEDSVYKWIEDEFLTYSLNEKGITGFYINSNGPQDAAAIKGEMEGDKKFILDGESDWYKSKWTYELKDGKLHRKIELTDKKENKKDSVERVFTKIKSK